MSCQISGLRSTDGAKSPLHRAFYAEADGDEPDTQFRGFSSGSFDGTRDRLLPYCGQHEYGAGASSSEAKKSFDLYAQLIVARNPFTRDGDSEKYVVILSVVKKVSWPKRKR